LTETDAKPVDTALLFSARIAVSVSFFIFGMGFALWAVHIPVVAQRLQLDPAVLGIALLNVGLGGVISQPLTGWLVAHTGSRAAARVLLPITMLAFIAPIIAWATPVFFVATFAIGLAGGASNVALNVQAAEIERARGLPTMSSFHGFFSLGALVGAGVGSGIIAMGWQQGEGAAGVAGVLVAVAIVVTRHFMASQPSPKIPGKAGERRLALPNAAMLGLAVLIFFSNTVEGAVNDWSALYLSKVRGLSESAAASGFGAFSAAMAICRLAGGPVVARLGERNIVLFGGVLIALGLVVVVVSPWATLSPFGFALVAIGAANTIPVMMGIASRLPGVVPSTAVATTATAALLGFLLGPPAIGFVAHAMGLGVALGLLSLVGVVIVVGALLYKWPMPGNAAQGDGRTTAG
jgi:MFS family permease